MRLDEIARRLGCTLEGPPDLEIVGVAGIEAAQDDELTFVSNPKYVSKIPTTRAGAILVSERIDTGGVPRLISDNPYLSFAQAIGLFYAPPRPIPGIHPTAWIAEGVEIGEGHSIGAHVVIDSGVRIGRGCVLHPHVVIYPEAVIGEDFVAHSHAVVRECTRIGDRVTLQNGAVIGADGFGFAPDAQGRYQKIPQAGIAVLEDDVEVGVHACVDRATVGETRVERGAKLDNLVQVGHGACIGPDSVVAAQAGVSGSSKLGRNVRLGGQVGVAGHIQIGDNVSATPQTGIAQSVEAGRWISGSPAVDSPLWKKNYILMKQFPEMARTLRRLVKEVEELKKGAR